MYLHVYTLMRSPLWHPLLVLAGALALDVTVGEPPSAVHPVVWMGRWSRALRRLAPRDPAGAFAWGCVMATTGPLVAAVVAWLAARWLASWPLGQLAVEVYLFKSAFALRALGAAARAVAEPLAAGDIAGARAALRSLVSRDPSTLSPALVAAAAVESVAENTSDSLVAPLCWFLVGGVPAALAYRAVNTLDAMIGYRGETEWLGKAAARLDDVANLVPARVTAALLVVASALVGAAPARALKVWLRDGGRTASPNAGRPMAAMAGALGVQLEKVGHYRLGDEGALPGAGEIARAITLMNVAAGLAAVAAAAIVYVAHG
jgi:adenosylcobinamide-phosphate synthase